MNIRRLISQQPILPITPYICIILKKKQRKKKVTSQLHLIIPVLQKCGVDPTFPHKSIKLENPPEAITRRQLRDLNTILVIRHIDIPSLARCKGYRLQRRRERVSG